MNKIFPLTDQLRILEQYKSECFSKIDTSFIIGGRNSCKTALLMQAAISESSREKSQNQVLFIAPRKLNKLPPCVHNMPTPSSYSMERVRFLYASSVIELQGYMAAFHTNLTQDKPALIIVDDLDFYFSSISDSTSCMVAIVRIVCLLQESATNWNGNGKQSQVIISWNENSNTSTKDLEILLKQYCKDVWKIHREFGIEDTNSCISKFSLTQSFEEVKCNITFSLRKAIAKTIIDFEEMSLDV